MPNKVIVITGANRGLGKALAKAFAEDGEKVVLLGRRLEKVQATAAAVGHGAIGLECEVGSPDSVTAAFKQIAATYPKIDALINNAGIFKQFKIENGTDKQIIDHILTNLAGPMLTARSAIPMLGRGGHIINITSESVTLELPMLCAYQSAKAGVERFSSALNWELEDKGIRVTNVRAGQMISATEPMEDMDMDAMMVFLDEAKKRGFDMMTRGQSLYESTIGLFRLIINAPADLQITQIAVQGRPAA